MSPLPTMARRLVRALTAAALTLSALVLAPAASHAAPAAPAAGTPLRTLAANHGIPIGSAVNVDALRNDSTYRSVLAAQFSSVTPENAFKWGVTEPQQDHFDYADADYLVDFAQDHDMRVYGHNLVWYKNIPAWVTDGGYSASELASILHNHIIEEVQHFGTAVWAWDVVNEPFNDDGTLRHNIWYGAMGKDYIANALRWAHSAAPDAKLFINDYNIEWVSNAKAQAMLDLVKELKADGIPISGVGFQTHRRTSLPDDYYGNLKRFTDNGFDVAVTEIDRQIPVPTTSSGLADQADTYSRAMQACLRLTKCVSFSTWGFTDKYSSATGDGTGAACIYDENYATKPAYTALQTALG